MVFFLSISVDHDEKLWLFNGCERYNQGLYKQVCVKLKDFQGLLKDSPMVFKDNTLIYTLKFYLVNARLRWKK